MLHRILRPGCHPEFVSVLIILLAYPENLHSQDITARKIWDSAPHNAFTDIIRYKSYFYCSFREGINHVHRDSTGNGKVRVLRSKDGEKWESTALLTKTGNG